LPDLILGGTNGHRDHLEDKVSGALAGPFVSMMQNSAQRARIFRLWTANRLLQQPQPVSVIATPLDGNLTLFSLRCHKAAMIYLKSRAG
jgi:hypothetical protein